jgi:hypothetical protein
MKNMPRVSVTIGRWRREFEYVRVGRVNQPEDMVQKAHLCLGDAIFAGGRKSGPDKPSPGWTVMMTAPRNEKTFFSNLTSIQHHCFSTNPSSFRTVYLKMSKREANDAHWQRLFRGYLF